MSEYAKRNDEGDHRILEDDPKAIRLLKDEHHQFRILFDQANAAENGSEELVRIARELDLRLTVHMTIEEEILYPAGKKVDEDEEVYEGIVEHEAGKTMMEEIAAMDGSEALFKSKVHVLGEQTIHHIDEEDEDLFAEMKEAHADGKIDLDEIGDRLRARQAELYDKVADGEDVEPLTEDEVLSEEPAE